MGLPAYESSVDQARRIPEILASDGFVVADVPTKANAMPAKPSFFYTVSDGKHTATLFGEWEPERVVTIIVPRSSFRFGKRRFLAELRSTLLRAGFSDYPKDKNA